MGLPSLRIHCWMWGWSPAQEAVPAAHWAHTAGQVPQLSAAVASCIYRYRRKSIMFFLLYSVFLLNPCFHVRSCSEKCRGNNFSTPLTFYKWNVTVCRGRFSHWQGAACSRDAAHSTTVDISMISIRPLGSAAVQSPIWLKKRGKEKKKTNLVSPGKGATHVLMTDTF